MKLLDNLKKVVKLLSPWSGCWAICGGVAAAIYRDTPRYTADLDIALIDHPQKTAREIAESVVKALGYVPKDGFITDEHGKMQFPQALVVGRESVAGPYIGIDFLLPILPWIPDAVRRAQLNLLDFGFEKLPTITPEDLFIAKLFAVQKSPERVNDLDDLMSMARGGMVFDSSYFKERIARYKLIIPRILEEHLANILT